MPRQTAIGLVTGAAAIAVVSAVIAVLKQWIDPDGLTGLYLFAILPVAIVWGFWLAGIVALGVVPGVLLLLRPARAPLRDRAG